MSLLSSENFTSQYLSIAILHSTPPERNSAQTYDYFSFIKNGFFCHIISPY